MAFIGYSFSKRRIKEIGESPISLIDKLLIGFYYIGSKYWADSSLNYLDYIIKVVGKSCKSASIIIIAILFNLPIIGAIFKKLVNVQSVKKIKTTDIYKVILTTASVLLFNFSPNQKKSKSKKLLHLLFQQLIQLRWQLGQLLNLILQQI